ncbi:MAG: sugar nucleotide-binding protein [Porticoccaceae bacterium]
MKTLFVGCGDLGMRAIAQLVSAPAENVVCHALRRRIERLPEGMPATAGDLRDTAAITALLDREQFDVLVITLTPEQISDQGYRDSYVAGAKSLAAVLGATVHVPALVIWVSSTGVYGQSSGEWVDELSETVPSSYRGERLLEAENIVRQLPVATVIVRYSGIYGPGRGRLLQQVREGRLAPPEPLQWSNRIHAEDAAAVLVHLLGKWREGEVLQPLYLATDDEPVPLYEVHRWLAEQMGLAGKLPKAGDAARSMPGGNRRCSNRRLRDSGFRFRYPTFREGYRVLLEKGGE